MTSQNNNTLPKEAEEGFKDAASYDAYRPSYPPDAFEKFLSSLKIAQYPSAKIVEIASGTGKFTELIAQRPEGFVVKAIEPHHTMRDKLVQKDLPGVEVIDGKADKMPVEDEWGDACVAAQAFHWFATPEALKEIHRVLRPGAVFGAIWNIEDYNKPHSWPSTTKWEQKLNDFIYSLDDGLPRFKHQKWKDVFEQQLPATPLQALKDTFTDGMPKFSLPRGEDIVKWTVWLSEEELSLRLNTLSQIAIFKGDERDAWNRLLKETLEGDDVERNEKGQIAVHGITFFTWTDRL
ncbi:S-adenosyl-L-methionine-dependent methyltransferase [Annulohypoxylon maeteangense]|uniref:S-adenosyl-L-methionine-dependent methyltransferase n=1 Tax=Annulohypoxylon maeteangense TaxID=1927788 RepID=UPI0020073908|nr:S-adenosyl-L-methionine-dependent methyltransferase [Annulohypoxylon maeteangense]KAI0889723.1 S-adenosyl-L-methionine-dependent methyltransferase [Annulohypoxylon maeteangense]